MIWNLLEYFIDGIKALALSLIFLVFGILFLPNSWIIKTLSRLKPKIIDQIKEPFRNFLHIFSNLYINNELIDLNSDYEDFNSRSEYLLKENKKIDKNIYVIDLCKDMLAMLGYVLPGTIHGNGYNIYEQSMSYLYHYSRIAEHIDQDKNFIANFMQKIEDFRNLYEASSENGIENNQDASDKMVEFYSRVILKYLMEERLKLIELSKFNKDELLSLLKGKVNAL